MTKHVASTTKKLFATGCLAVSLAGLGLFAGVGTAAATAPDTGSYDELLNIPDDPAIHEVPDTGSYDELLGIGDSNGFQGDKP